jgi:hypothetical protein
MADNNNPAPQANPESAAPVTPPVTTPPASDPATPPAATPPAEQLLSYTDFVVPEGFDLGPSKEEVIAFAKENKLTQAAAQKLVDMGVKLGKTTMDSMVKAETENQLKTRDAWVNSLKADKDFGGEKFDENVNRAKRMVKTLNDPELNKFLDGEQGYGDHPSLVKAFAKLDRMINAEANFIEGGAPSPQALNAADVLFGDMFKQ